MRNRWSRNSRLSHMASTLLLALFLVLALGIGFANLMLWDAAFNSCMAREGSSLWCRFTEEWQIFRYILGF